MPTIATPTLWVATLIGFALLLLVDFIATRKPHEVSLREATGWSIFYIALPLAFGGWLWFHYEPSVAIPYLSGYLVEKALSVDNLFVFMVVLAQFAVPAKLQQRVLLWGIIGALILRGIFIALGATFLGRFSWLFLLMGLFLVYTGIGLFRQARQGHDTNVDTDSIWLVRLTKRFMPVSDSYVGKDGGAWTTRIDGRRALTPFALVVIAVFAVDIVFAFDSVPAVYGITQDPYLVFVTNAFALLGLRALYFVLDALLHRLHLLNYGLAFILAFIGIKLAIHWAHLTWPSIPEIPTMLSLGIIVGTLVIVTIASLIIPNNNPKASEQAAKSAMPDGAVAAGSPEPQPPTPGATNGTDGTTDSSTGG